MSNSTSEAQLQAEIEELKLRLSTSPEHQIGELARAIAKVELRLDGLWHEVRIAKEAAQTAVLEAKSLRGVVASLGGSMLEAHEATRKSVCDLIEGLPCGGNTPPCPFTPTEPAPAFPPGE